ncbi:MAG TPA: glycosyl hydrolase [Ktedonobacterales bacterium]|nr:glycosyl hydrolase [Ktedonobacterales bacterium]
MRYRAPRRPTVLSAIFVPLAFLVVLAGCGSGKAKTTATPTPTSARANGATPSATAGQTQGAHHPLAGINVEPSMRPWRYTGANPDGWWCVPPNCYQNADPTATINAELSLAQQLEVTIVRVEFPWPLIEPQRGVFDWSRADAIVLAAGSHNVQLQPVLVYTPAWSDSGGMTLTPGSGDYASFVAAIVARYHTTIHYWELWNEPDGSHYWNSGEQAYVASVLTPGYQAAKAAEPQARIILGGPASADAKWLNGVYDLGGGNSFDIMAFHDYGGGTSELTDAIAVEAILSAHGQASKPLWLGEYGVQENTTADAGQQYLLRTVLTATNSPIAVAEWYNLRDDYSMTCCPAQVAVTGNWGLVQHDDVTKKDAFATLRQLIAGG